MCTYYLTNNPQDMTSIGNLGMVNGGTNIPSYWIPGADVDGVHRQYNPIKRRRRFFFFLVLMKRTRLLVSHRKKKEDLMQDFPADGVSAGRILVFFFLLFFPSLNGMSIEPAREKERMDAEGASDRIQSSSLLVRLFR